MNILCIRSPMKKFNIEITETVQRQIEVEADSYDEALKIVKQKYRNSEIVLDSTDFIDTEFRLITKSKHKDHHER